MNYIDPQRGMTYEEACIEATTHQGLDPIVDTLRAAGIPHAVDQTGGFCMVVNVPLNEGGTSYLYLVDAAYQYGEPWGAAGEGVAGSRYWMCNDDLSCAGQCEGVDIVDGGEDGIFYGATSFPMCDLVMYVRQHIADNRPCPCGRDS